MHTTVNMLQAKSSLPRLVECVPFSQHALCASLHHVGISLWHLCGQHLGMPAETPEWRMFLTVGFCGGFTNFFRFALYASLSVFLGLLATYFGTLVTKVL